MEQFKNSLSSSSEKKSGSGTSDDLDTWYDDDKELNDQLDFLEPYVTINRSRSMHGIFVIILINTSYHCFKMYNCKTSMLYITIRCRL